MANSTSNNGNQIRIGYMRSNRPNLPQPPAVNNFLPRDYIAPTPRADRSSYLSASVRPENEMGRANSKVGRVADPTADNTTTGSQSIILGSRNINFTVPILSWGGRAGMGVSLALSYNSTAWINDPFSGKLAFNSDNGFPSPGWRLGFGQLQGGDPSPGADWIPPFWNQDVAAYTYIWVEADGTRRTLIGGATIDTDLYLSNDSSQIEYNKQNGVMRLGGGTQVRFTTPKDTLGQALGNEMLPSEIKDRNGNYIAITNEDIGGRWAITRITDTLGRVIEFRYENGFPIEIGQQRGGEWRSYPKLYYTGITIHTDFQGVEIDPPDIEGEQIVEPWYIEFQNGMNYRFFYTSYCQAYQIEKWAPAIDGQGIDRCVAYSWYDLPSVGRQSEPPGALKEPADNDTPQSECPRFAERIDWAEFWNNSQEAAHNYSYFDITDGKGAKIIDPLKRVYRTDVSTDGLTQTSRVWADEASYGTDSAPIQP